MLQLHTFSNILVLTAPHHDASIIGNLTLDILNLGNSMFVFGGLSFSINECLPSKLSIRNTKLLSGTGKTQMSGLTQLERQSQLRIAVNIPYLSDFEVGIKSYTQSSNLPMPSAKDQA